MLWPVLVLGSATSQNGAVLGNWGLVQAIPGRAPTPPPTTTTHPPTATHPTSAPTWVAASNVFACNTSHYFHNVGPEDANTVVPATQILIPTITETGAAQDGLLYTLDIRLWQAQYTTIVHRVKTYPAVPLYHFVEVVPSQYTTSLVTVKSYVCDHVIEVSVSSRVETTNGETNYKSQLFQRCGPELVVFNMSCVESAEYDPADVECFCKNGTFRGTDLTPTNCAEGCVPYGGCENARYEIPPVISTSPPTPSSAPTTAIVAPPPPAPDHVPAECMVVEPSISINTNNTVVLGSDVCSVSALQWCNDGTFWTLENYAIYADATPTADWDPTTATDELNTAIVTALEPYIESAFQIGANGLPNPPCLCASERRPFWSRHSELVRLALLSIPAITTAPTAVPTTVPTSAAPTSPTSASPTSPPPTLPPSFPSSVPFPVYPTQCNGTWAMCLDPPIVYCQPTGTPTFPTCNKNLPCRGTARVYTTAMVTGQSAAAGVEFAGTGSYGCGTTVNGTDIPYDIQSYDVKTYAYCAAAYRLCVATDTTIVSEYCVSGVPSESCDKTNLCEGASFVGSMAGGLVNRACSGGTLSPTNVVPTTTPTMPPTSAPNTPAPSKHPTVYYGPWDNADIVMVRNFWNVQKQVDYLWHYELMGPVLLAHINSSTNAYLGRIEPNHALGDSQLDVLMPSVATCAGTPGCMSLVNPYTIYVDNASDPVYQCLWVEVKFASPPGNNGPINIQVSTTLSNSIPDFFAILNSAFMNQFMGAPTWQATLVKLGKASNSVVNMTVNNMLASTFWTPWVNITYQYVKAHNMDTTATPDLNCVGMDGEDCRPLMKFYTSYAAWRTARQPLTQMYLDAINTDTNWLERFVTNESTMVPLFPEFDVVNTTDATGKLFPEDNINEYRLQFLNLYAQVVMHQSIADCGPAYTEPITLVGWSAELVVTVTRDVTGCTTENPCYSSYGSHRACGDVLPANEATCNSVPLCYWCIGSDSATIAPTPPGFLNLTFAPTTHKAADSPLLVDMGSTTIVIAVIVGVVVALLLGVVCVAMYRISRAGSGYALVNGE